MSNTGQTTIIFRADDSVTASSQECELCVKCYCSDEVISGVTVLLDGEEIGQTDEEGLINLGELEVGTEHELKLIKTGYKSSNEDTLKNDSFVVPEVDTEKESEEE